VDCQEIDAEGQRQEMSRFAALIGYNTFQTTCGGVYQHVMGIVMN
jgi:hypothetical protein